MRESPSCKQAKAMPKCRPLGENYLPLMQVHHHFRKLGLSNADQIFAPQYEMR